MNILDEFEQRTIEVRGENDKIKKRVAWCYGELYIVDIKLDGEHKWQIGCTPLGLAFPEDDLGLYESIEDACGAVKELTRINNCWSRLEDFGPKERKQLTDVAAKFNGRRVLTVQHLTGISNAQTVVPNLNGANPDNYR